MKIVSLAFVLVPALALAEPPPSTAKHPVRATYHGVTVTDDYQWLEKESPDTRAFIDAQNAWARQQLDGIPFRAQLAARLTQLETHPSPRSFDLERHGGHWFALKHAPPKQHPMLVTFRSPDDPRSERVVVDPDAVDPTGRTAIDWYVISSDGKRAAVSLSQNGSERGTLHLYDVSSGKALADVIPRVQVATAGGSAAFDASGSGLYYTRYPLKGEKPDGELDFWQEVWFHELGTPVEKDSYVLGRGFPKIAEIALVPSEDGQWLLAEVGNGDGGEFMHWVRALDGKWTQLTRFEDKIVRARFGRDGALYLLSRKDAPKGKLLRLRLSSLDLSKAQVIVPEGQGAIQSYAAEASRLYVAELDGGPSRVRIYDLAGKAASDLKLPAVSSVGQLARGDGDELLVDLESYVEPQAWYGWDGHALAKTQLRMTAPADTRDLEVTRELVPSTGGTRVPINIVRKRGTPFDASHPVLLTAYGGYGISSTPYFSAHRLAWLEQGGVFVEANIRGGGEFGDAWHQDGKLGKKQNVFDDFVAVARWLVEHKVTRPERLAIFGGSNGGLLMGACLTQHPELFGAVVASRGIFDMLRFEEWPNGQFNTTEFGSVKTTDGFRTLYAYSPYHHVKDGAKYPPVLLITGTHDVRVAPSDSFKLAARLQAAGARALLRASDKSGHGVGTALEERIAEHVDLYAFLFQTLGVPYRSPTEHAAR